MLMAVKTQEVEDILKFLHIFLKFGRACMYFSRSMFGFKIQTFIVICVIHSALDAELFWCLEMIEAMDQRRWRLKLSIG